MNEYLIKLATINEYKEMIKYKLLYEELCQSFKAIMEEIFRYCQRNNIELPERQFINKTMDKAQELIEKRIAYTENADSSDGFFHREDPDGDFTMPMKDGFKYHIRFLMDR